MVVTQCTSLQFKKENGQECHVVLVDAAEGFSKDEVKFWGKYIAYVEEVELNDEENTSYNLLKLLEPHEEGFTEITEGRIFDEVKQYFLKVGCI